MNEIMKSCDYRQLTVFDTQGIRLLCPYSSKLSVYIYQ